MRIAEIFSSKQGEGVWTGVPSSFIRVIGCNLRCSFCDTKYASWYPEEGEEMTLEEIISIVMRMDQKHVVITGGEPMLFTETILLTKLLRDMKYKITIETSGTMDLPVECDLMSISPKLSNSNPLNATSKLRHLHETNRSHPDIVCNLIHNYNYQLKFVVDEPEDLLEMEEYIAMLDDVNPSHVYLMPLATDASVMWSKSEWIIPYCLKRQFQYCPRMQLEWYGNRRGT